jgi:FlaA1/EpsC-like NDP-sugar epimerase
MTLDQAASMLLDCLARAQGGEVFITKMPALRVADLAEVMVELIAPLFGHDPASVKVVERGAQPGEKFFEELTSQEELRRTFDDGGLFVVMPAFVPAPPKAPVQQVLNSSEETPMTKDAIARFLTHPDVLSDDVRSRLLKSGRVPAGA